MGRKKDKTVPTKGRICVSRKNFDSYGGFEGVSFDDIRKILNDFEKTSLKKDNRAVHFIVETLPFGHDGGFDIRFSSYRDETDEEFADRLDVIAKKEEDRKQERIRKLEAQLEKLKS